jgi:serine/threonine-protein kinase
MGADRFLREIRMAARLQHPHILTVLDSGEIPVPGAPPILWFTMPYIRGESLRDRLDREAQLPVDEALRIAREAADALDYAHQEGIIHRDIKPENILLTGSRERGTGGGHALVADFGIARALGEADDSRDDKLTETGMTVGTPAYMSPEQASGQRELDPRTDVYSLAVVLYEMLAGETPFAAPTAQAMIARRFMETARPVRPLREAVPEAVEAALQKALARTNTAANMAVAARYPRLRVMLRVSPAVSPRVVARILSTQNVSVTAGTLAAGKSRNLRLSVGLGHRGRRGGRRPGLPYAGAELGALGLAFRAAFAAARARSSAFRALIAAIRSPSGTSSFPSGLAA